MAETERNGEKAQPDYLTPKEAGDLLRRSDKTIYRISRADPTFPCTRVGGSLLVPRKRLMKWLDQRTQGRA